MRIRRATMALALLLALALATLLSLCTGAAKLSPDEALQGLLAGPPGAGADAAAAQGIVWNIRLPRLLLALLVGAGLAVAGVVMQAYFQNPMADPYIVGVSAGGALGATAGLVIWSANTIFGLTTRSLFAFLGATGVTILVYCLARRGGRVHTVMLLLTGLATSALASALSSLLVMVAKASDMRLVVFWLMGSVADRGWTAVWVLAGPVLLVLLVTWVFSRELNVILLGEEVAHHLGVDVERTKLILLALSAVLAASCVAISGMIGFVGLIIPHLMRLLTGPDHRTLIPAAALGGGVLLAAADVVARTAAAPIEIPIGIVTSILGCPFFLFLLHRARLVRP
jgi:iron complex transport system permease protein